MNHWIEYSADGRILSSARCHDEPPSMYGGTVLSVQHKVDARRSLYLNGEVVDVGQAPSPFHRINPATRSWVREQTDDEKIEAVRVRLQRVMDDAARALGYDDIKTAITYADEPAVPKFQAEGQAFRVWRSRVWAACYEHPAMLGQEPIPTPDEAEALMPALVLPGT
jgi:hypothetical protein